MRAKNEAATLGTSANSAIKSNQGSQLFENKIGAQKLFDKKSLAKMWGISIRYVDKLMAIEGLPYFKIGKSVRFQSEAVSTWLLKRRMP